MVAKVSLDLVFIIVRTRRVPFHWGMGGKIKKCSLEYELVCPFARIPAPKGMTWGGGWGRFPGRSGARLRVQRQP
jgi:hypothetical protein